VRSEPRRGAALAYVQRPRLTILLSFVRPKRVATGGSRERPNAIFCPAVLLAVDFSRTYRPAKRWVIRGRRLLSRFPVLTRDRTKNRVVTRQAFKRLPSRVPTAPRLVPRTREGSAPPENRKKAAHYAALSCKLFQPILGYWLLAIKTTRALRSDHLSLPDAAIVILPGDFRSAWTESAEADSATCRC
jgi:hypothetical protein